MSYVNSINPDNIVISKENSKPNFYYFFNSYI